MATPPSNQVHESKKKSVTRSVLEGLWGKSAGAILLTLFFVTADGLHWLFFEDLNLFFLDFLSTPSKEAVILILTLFVAYSIALGLLQTLESDTAPKSSRKKKKDDGINFSITTFGFGILLIMALAQITMGDHRGTALSEDWQAIGVAGGTGVLLLIYLPLGCVKWIKPRHGKDTARYYFYLVPTVIMGELMLNFSYAMWAFWLSPDPGAPAVEDPNQLLSFIIIAPLFFLFFAGPRFIFWRLNNRGATMISSLWIAFYELWRMMGETPIV
jgi:hypothetical protein